MLENIKAPTAARSCSVIEAAIFDLDGVLTDTAKVHEAAWREAFWPHSISHEAYLKYVDGRTREDGIRTFLKSVTPPERRRLHHPRKCCPRRAVQSLRLENRRG